MDVNRPSVPLLALSIEAQTMLSTLLNPTRIIPTETNLPRDWRGIAELANVPTEKMALFETDKDPFKELWKHISGAQISIDDFKAFMGVIDRFDVIDDVTPIFDRDARAYQAKVSELRLDHAVGTLEDSQDSNILTYEDALRHQSNLPLCRYDAFILYSEDDSTFAAEVIQRMESEFNMKLCSKDRDLLAGLRFEHEVISKMIEERCNRVLVIFSPSFLKSPANQFLVSYAQALALDTRSRKIIPCVYKQCDLPPSVRYSFCIRYDRSSKLVNFWDKLGQSLKVAQTTNNHVDLPTKTVSLDTSDWALDKKSSLDDKDSLDWWEAEKPTKLAAPSCLDKSRTGSGCDANLYAPTYDDHNMDTVSMHSQANLLPARDSTKPSKLFSKLLSPLNRKKRIDKDKSKQKPIAE